MNSVIFRNNSAGKLIFVFAVLAIFMALGSYVLFTAQKNKIISEKQNELASITHLKVQQIVNWRNERLGNAQSAFHNQSFINDVEKIIAGESRKESFKRISEWINYQKKKLSFFCCLIIG